ncbi:hypothetical protein PIB30_091325, partial [Stylosanthes scabra]|nr:hypothetical protein [Stylosanthes scabra]
MDKRMWTDEETKAFVGFMEEVVADGMKADCGQFKPRTFEKAHIPCASSQYKMVKKATLQKDKRQKTDVQYDKGHRTRCSPSELANTYIDLKEDKLALVHEMGFGTLVKNVSNYYFSNLIMMELADSFHIPDSTIRTNVGNFKINAAKVGNAFGLNFRGGFDACAS